ncbi:MAG: hypothetical protein BECKG1743D_GA0114223_105421 [Candidatus Kentron sp. G]|nr:MAG: hypothetical protein BECKG1743F_GA0114225_103402 [Candidatus Kentron sp. G]VFN03519.1 MAG: hypothetical protein BECKG1743E_GA0114224_106261 [Candidatus Kentron sp. G]VFN04058.1 MAG: hypothetical protein BECKG1743D_GA0114223_105421 [Candidatus Kentron sp. G]
MWDATPEITRAVTLGLQTQIEKLKQMIKAKGEKEASRIRISHRMEARLSSTDFSITAITPEIQAISRNNVTEWKWKIKPNSIGKSYLHLTLSVLLDLDNAPTPRTIRTFDKVIEVDVLWYQQVSSFLGKYLDWVWFAIFIPIIGWVWNRKKCS